MPKYPQVKVRLVGEDGNAFSIMGRITSAMKRAGIPQDEIKLYQSESTSGDYNNLLRTAMEWVTCDAEEQTTSRYAVGNHHTRYLDSPLVEHWLAVEDALETARLIAFDGCHKMYIAMDDEEANDFRKSYNEHGAMTFEGTPVEMMAQLQTWWENSCGLKFIYSVTTNTENPNAGYDALIPQGAEDEFRCDECDSFGAIYADHLCESCWMSEEENEDEDEDY